jgi:hypothetical protein
MKLSHLVTSLSAFGLLLAAGACSSRSSGGGPIPCGADKPPCPDGFVCGANQFCAPITGSGGSGGGGGTGGTAGTGGTGSGCEGACSKLSSVSCANSQTQTECVQECESSRQQMGGCVGQFDGYIACLNANATVGCDADGDPSFDDGGACNAALTTLSNCLSGSGGSSGSGGFGGSGGSAGSGGFGGSGGSGATGGTGGSGGQCSTSWQGLTCDQVWDTSSACGACLGTTCCSETTWCFQNYECAGLQECIATYCSTASDVNVCVQQYCPGCVTQSAVDDYNAIADCAQTYCASDCS